MTPITLANFLDASQHNINEFLAKYFDGGSHNIGGVPHTFPLCEIKFGRHQLPRQLAGPYIIIESGTGAPADRNFAGTARITTQRDYPWRFVIATQNANKDNAPDWKVNDNVTSLLTLILTAARGELAVGGQKIIRLSVATKIPDPTIQFSQLQAVMRSLCETGTN